MKGFESHGKSDGDTAGACDDITRPAIFRVNFRNNQRNVVYLTKLGGGVNDDTTGFCSYGHELCRNQRTRREKGKVISPKVKVGYGNHVQRLIITERNPLPHRD